VPVAAVGELRIRYELVGPEYAPALAFSNSLGTDLSMWDAQCEVLSRRFRILRYDMRGQGESSVVRGDSSIGEFARDFLGLLDALGLKRVSFCGLSMGGMIGMWLGANAPERLDALVLSNTAARIGTKEMWNARITRVRQGGMKSVTDAVMERWFTSQFRAACPVLVERSRTMLQASPVEGYASCCSAIRDMDQTDSIAQIRVRTLVIAGLRDSVTSPEEGRFLVERISGSQIAELDAAHLSNIEQADGFTSALRSFLLTPGQANG
jgi:3-oxoadipate enol-lactonase